MKRANGNSPESHGSQRQLFTGILVGAAISVLSFVVITNILDNLRSTSSTSSQGENRDNRFVSGSNTARQYDFLSGVAESDSSHLTPFFYAQSDEVEAEELLSHVRQSVEMDPTALLIEAQDLLMGRLARSDPEQAFKETWKFPVSRWTDLIGVVFGEWASSNPQDAFTNASNLSGALRESAVLAILDQLGDPSIEEIGVLTQENGIQSIVDRRIAEERALSLLDRPDVAWNMVVQDNVDNRDQEALLLKIADKWLQSGQFDVLRHLYGRQSPFFVNIGFQTKVESLVAERDLKGAVDYLSTLPVDEQRVLTSTLLSRLAQHDHEQAFEFASMPSQILMRKSAQWAVIGVWASKNPQDLLQRTLEFPQELRQSVVSAAIRSIARESPANAAKQLQRARAMLGSIDEQSELAVIEEWIKIDPMAASKWAVLAMEEGSRSRARGMQRIVYRIAQDDPETALSLALAEEPHAWNSKSGLETYVVESLVAQGEIEEAIEILGRVRESAQRMSFYHVGTGLIELDRSTDAIQIADRLSEDVQVAYLGSLVYTWLTRSPVDLVDKISTLPSDRARTEVSRKALSMIDSPFVTLTDAQVDRLESYVAEGVPEQDPS